MSLNNDIATPSCGSSAQSQQRAVLMPSLATQPCTCSYNGCRADCISTMVAAVRPPGQHCLAMPWLMDLRNFLAQRACLPGVASICRSMLRAPWNRSDIICHEIQCQAVSVAELTVSIIPPATLVCVKNPMAELLAGIGQGMSVHAGMQQLPTCAI